MKKSLVLLTALFSLTFFASCSKEPVELYINSEFSEVTMKNIYGESRNVARAILDNTFATEDGEAVSFILPAKWQDYASRIQVQTIEGGIGVYTLAEDYELSSLDFSPYYADLFAIIYVSKDEGDALISKYADYFEKNRYLGYMDDKVCYLLYNEQINTERSTMFSSEECRDWERFLKIVSDIDGYIMLSANE